MACAKITRPLMRMEGRVALSGSICLRWGPTLVLGKFIGPDINHPALDPLDRAITHLQVDPVCAVIVILNRKVILRPRSLTVTVKHQVDVRWANHLAAEPKNRVLV